jgi:hypothetical protein
VVTIAASKLCVTHCLNASVSTRHTKTTGLKTNVRCLPHLEMHVPPWVFRKRSG